MSQRAFLTVLGTFAVALAGCGSDDSADTTPAPSSQSSAEVEDFPKGASASFSDL
jgi:hypothetical protein